MEKLKYDLKEKFNLAKKGDMEEANFLVVNAPSNKVINHVSFIDREVNKAIMTFSKDQIVDSAKRPDVPENQEISSEELLMALQAGNGNMEKCYGALKQILISSCMVDETIPFTSSMYEKMHYQDTKSLLGEYIKFFLTSSLLS